MKVRKPHGTNSSTFAITGMTITASICVEIGRDATRFAR
jgi:hypothetical protein